MGNIVKTYPKDQVLDMIFYYQLNQMERPQYIEYLQFMVPMEKESCSLEWYLIPQELRDILVDWDAIEQFEKNDSTFDYRFFPLICYDLKAGNSLLSNYLLEKTLLRNFDIEAKVIGEENLSYATCPACEQRALEAVFPDTYCICHYCLWLWNADSESISKEEHIRQHVKKFKALCRKAEKRFPKSIRVYYEPYDFFLVWTSREKIKERRYQAASDDERQLYLNTQEKIDEDYDLMRYHPEYLENRRDHYIVSKG